MSKTPNAFARDIIRVQNNPIPVNYDSSREIGGSYSAKCLNCNSWQRGDSKEEAVKEAKMCCRNCKQ